VTLGKQLKSKSDDKERNLLFTMRSLNCGCMRFAADVTGTSPLWGAVLAGTAVKHTWLLLPIRDSRGFEHTLIRLECNREIFQTNVYIRETQRILSSWSTQINVLLETLNIMMMIYKSNNYSNSFSYFYF